MRLSRVLVRFLDGLSVCRPMLLLPHRGGHPVVRDPFPLQELDVGPLHERPALGHLQFAGPLLAPRPLQVAVPVGKADHLSEDRLPGARDGVAEGTGVALRQVARGAEGRAGEADQRLEPLLRRRLRLQRQRLPVGRQDRPPGWLHAALLEVELRLAAPLRAVGTADAVQLAGVLEDQFDRHRVAAAAARIPRRERAPVRAEERDVDGADQRGLACPVRAEDREQALRNL